MIDNVLPPTTTALGLTVKVCPAIVTKAVDVPVGRTTFEPPIYTDELPICTGTPATKVTVAEAAPWNVVTGTGTITGVNGELNAELMMLPSPPTPGEDVLAAGEPLLLLFALLPAPGPLLPGDWEGNIMPVVVAGDRPSLVDSPALPPSVLR